MFTLVFFCDMSLHTDGSKSAQLPRNQLVNLVISWDFTFPQVFGKNVFFTINAIVIIIDIIVIINFTN